MNVYRIARTEYILDLSGYGAKLHGGRWNREGVAIVYTGGSISLCAWEYWVHLPNNVTLKEDAFSVATIQLPESPIEIVTANELPVDWQLADEPLFVITDQWIAKRSRLILQVPSAVIHQECNDLINPAHPDFTNVKVESVCSFEFDKRAFGKVLLTKL